MSLLHPSSIGAPVALWLSNGVPVRLVHGHTRYRVGDDPTPTADGWLLTARDAGGRTSTFDVVVTETGWELRGVS